MDELVSVRIRMIVRVGFVRPDRVRSPVGV